MTNDELYNELAHYTLSHPDPSFLHQHVVDAYAAQYADEAYQDDSNRVRLGRPLPLFGEGLLGEDGPEGAHATCETTQELGTSSLTSESRSYRDR